MRGGEGFIEREETTFRTLGWEGERGGENVLKERKLN